MYANKQTKKPSRYSTYTLSSFNLNNDFEKLYSKMISNTVFILVVACKNLNNNANGAITIEFSIYRVITSDSRAKTQGRYLISRLIMYVSIGVVTKTYE